MLRKALLTTHSKNGALENWSKQTMAWADDDMEIVAAMAKERGLTLEQAKAVQENLPCAQAPALPTGPVRGRLAPARYEGWGKHPSRVSGFPLVV
jgi:hypothetical protein